MPEHGPQDLSPVFIELEDPPGGRFHGASDVALDEDGNLLLLTRSPGGIFIYDRHGACHGRWQTPAFVLPHGITAGPAGKLCVVDQGAHAAFVYTGSTLVGTAGRPGQPSDTGCQWNLPRYQDRYLSITHGGRPFNNPTKAVFAPDGSLYVSDGYANTRVHHFSPALELIGSWGQPGSGAGQFRLPHSLCALEDGRIVVADRENERLQVFTGSGDFLEEWTGFQRPSAVTLCGQVLVIAELAWKEGDYSFAHGERPNASPGGVSVVDLAGRLVARYRGDPDIPTTWSPHGLALTEDGTAYLVDLTGRGLVATGDGGSYGESAGPRGIMTVRIPTRL